MRRWFFSGLLISSLIVGLSLVVFLSCDNIKTSYLGDSEKTKITLTYQTIFDLRTVQRARRGTEKYDRDLSLKMFEEAIERKKKGQFSRSSDLLKKSILIHPMPKSYYYLGEVALDLNQLDVAVSSFKMAENLNFSELGILYIRLSKTYSLKNDVEQATKYLTLGLQKGYKDLNSIMYDPAFKNIKSTPEYRGAVADVVLDERARKQALFELFISKFPVKTLPFALDNEAIENFDYEHYIPFDFEELLVSKYKRNESREYSFVGRIDSTEKYIAVVYSSIDAIEDDYPASVENYLVIYDKKGNILDHTIFACNCSPEITLSGQISENREITITEYQNIWKYDPATTEYIKNEIESTEVKSKHYFNISKYGRIRKIEKKEKEDSLFARI